MYSVNCCSFASFTSLRPLREINLSSEDDFAKQLAAMVQQVWKDKGMPNGLINKEVTSEFAKRLWAGVSEGYGDKATQFNDGSIDWNTPDFNKLAALQKNVWHFSAAKNYTQLRELSNALIGKDGKLLTFNEFKKVALSINDKHINQWLKAEYNLAVAGGQMAGKWVDIEANAEALPYLEFDAVLDKQTSDLCKGLNGTLLPVNHPFWNTYYPPNHFNCRSTVRQKATGVVTKKNNIPGAEIPPMFQTNLGKAGLVFPKGHSYFNDLPKDIEQGSMGAFRKELIDVAKTRLQNKVVEVDGLGEVTFNNKGIKEIFNQPHSQYLLKNQLAPISNLLLKNATLIKSVNDYKGLIKAYHYLAVEGLSEQFILVVKENQDGSKIMYSIVDGLK